VATTKPKASPRKNPKAKGAPSTSKSKGKKGMAASKEKDASSSSSSSSRKKGASSSSKEKDASLSSKKKDASSSSQEAASPGNCGGGGDDSHNAGASNADVNATGKSDYLTQEMKDYISTFLPKYFAFKARSHPKHVFLQNVLPEFLDKFPLEDYKLPPSTLKPMKVSGKLNKSQRQMRARRKYSEERRVLEVCMFLYPLIIS
jgi:hypothetical protein